MKETDCGFLSAVGACWGLCLWRVWKLRHLAAAASTFPAQLSLVDGEQLRWRQSAPAACRAWSLLCGRALLFEVVGHFSQLVYGNLYFLFCLFHTAVVNLDNSVVDLETLQALYENVSNRRFSVWECDTHSSCQCPPLASLPPCPLRKFDMGALNLHKSGFVKMYTF